MEEDAFVKPQGGPETAPDLLIYDLSKYLLSLCLLILGAVLTVQQSEAADIPTEALIVVIASLAVSGLLSLSCINQVVTARQAAKPARHIGLLNRLALGFLGMGVGGFLVIWTQQLL
jgi:hypothetical protein